MDGNKQNVKSILHSFFFHDIIKREVGEVLCKFECYMKFFQRIKSKGIISLNKTLT